MTSTDQDRLIIEKQLKHLEPHSRMWSKQRFWRKVVRYAKKAGREVLEKALMLYYIAQSDHVPGRVKVLVFSALGYFISTVDGIPDITPMLGFVDDLGVMAGVIALLSRWINPEIQSKVDQRMSEIFRQNEE